MFTDAEKAYIRSQPLARVATVSPDGEPDVAVVGFWFDGAVFVVSGHDQRQTLKHLNVKRGNPHVALVIDDLVSENPWRARMIKIHGHAEIFHADAVETPGFNAERQPVLKITPTRKWVLGINDPMTESRG